MEKKKKNQLKLDLFHSIHAHSERNHRKDQPGEKVTGMPSPAVPGPATVSWLAHTCPIPGSRAFSSSGGPLLCFSPSLLVFGSLSDCPPLMAVPS